MLPQGFEVKAYNGVGRLLHTLRSTPEQDQLLSSAITAKFDRLESLFGSLDYKGKPGDSSKSDPSNYVYVNMLVSDGRDAIKSIVMRHASGASQKLRIDDLSIGSSTVPG